jgi:hypothetical protein
VKEAFIGFSSILQSIRVWCLIVALWGSWHGCCGHLHYEVVSVLRDIVEGLLDFKIEQIGVCKGCALAKHSNSAFPSREQRLREIRELIRFDVCGPISSPSLKGKVYYVSFIDDSSREV